ncbi:MAG: hypothetical protein M0Q02_10890, partial [Candidatus Muirbacterium halophilum]|nr:hypothetical protein [Candidatus Muirbacterium halophilum]
LKLLNTYKEDFLIIESILIILKKRTDKDNVFLFIENLFHYSRNIRFLCFTYLFEKNIFFKFTSLLNKYMDFEKDIEIKGFIESIFKDDRNKDNEKNIVDNHTLIEAIIEKLFSLDKNTVMTAAFRIKNLNFPGKKQNIIKALINSNDLHTVQNLLYALNTENIQEEDSIQLKNILSQKPFYKALDYDMNMLKLNDFSLKKDIAWTKKIASLLVAITR